MMLSNTAETELLLGLGYCLFVLLLTLLSRKFPPRKINWYYGYRTHRSMRNEEVWKAANSYSLALMVKLSLFCLIVPLLLYFTYPSYNFVVTVMVNTILILSIYYFTERFLNNHFDKNGNPKQR